MTEKVFGNVKREPIFKPVLDQNSVDENTKSQEPTEQESTPSEPVAETDIREIVGAMATYLDVVHQEITDLKQAMDAVIHVIDQHGAQIGELSQDLTMTSGEIVRVSRYLGRQVKTCETAIASIPAYIQQEIGRQNGEGQPTPSPDTPQEENADTV
jgi:hypothetical protein